MLDFHNVVLSYCSSWQCIVVHVHFILHLADRANAPHINYYDSLDVDAHNNQAKEIENLEALYLLAIISAVWFTHIIVKMSFYVEKPWFVYVL